MRFFTFFVPLAAAAVLDTRDRHGVDGSLVVRDDSARHAVASPADIFRRAACNADNCSRAVAGTVMGLATRSAHLQDCSSFFAFTVTPATVTATATVLPAPITDTVTTTTTVTGASSTTTTDVEVYNNNKKRATNAAVTVSPTNVPAYASACSGTARFSSACSCAGVSSSYTTVSTPTTTITITATASTTTVTATATTTTASVTTVQDNIPCGQTIKGPDDGFSITVRCEMTRNAAGGFVVSTTTVGDWDQCVKLADDNFQATSFTYELDNKQCIIYRDDDSSFPSKPAAGIVFAYFPQN